MRPVDAPIVTAAEMRAAEAACFAGGASQTALMEAAARAIAREAARFAMGRPITVLFLTSDAGVERTLGSLGGGRVLLIKTLCKLVLWPSNRYRLSLEDSWS